MVEIKMTGMCEGCRQADLELEKMHIDSFVGDTDIPWKLRCLNYDLCCKWADKVKKAEIK